MPLNPLAFRDMELRDGDILICKDSNVGATAMIDGEHWTNFMFSSGIVRLHPSCDRHYLLAFLKHPIFKQQLATMAPRGATIVHGRTLWLDCLIPFPNQPDADAVIVYVSALTRAIVGKEKEIRRKHELLMAKIADELLRGQKPGQPAAPEHPRLAELKALGRLDVGMYSEGFKTKQQLIQNYAGGFGNYSDFGFSITRGQNLQVSAIGKSIYAQDERPGFYRLLLPTNITPFGLASEFDWLGNGKDLEILHQGDVVFGAEATFRCCVVCDAFDKPTISNIHAIILRKDSAPIWHKVFIGAWLRYLGQWGYSDAIAVGGQGGSLAIGYFQHVLIPRFPDELQMELAKLYHNPVPLGSVEPLLGDFLEWHLDRNASLGMWELTQELRALQRTLASVQHDIIRGIPASVPNRSTGLA